MKVVNAILQMLSKVPERFPKDIGHYSDLDLKKNGMWNRVADEMLIIFADSSRGSSALSRGPVKSEGGGKTLTHYNAEPATAVLLLRTITDWIG